MVHKGSQSNQVPVVGAWRTSSFSDGAQCVALAATSGGVALRNSNDHSQGVLELDRSQLQDLVAGIKAGELDDLSV